MPLSTSSVDRRIPEALSTSRGKPAGVSDGNGIQTMPGKGWKGYLEDRRPNSQGDPYKIASRILETIATVPVPK